jgi:hypothetical protein
MNRSSFGCLTPAGLLSAALTIIIVTIVVLIQGGVLFSPGLLNAQAGNPINGVTSHAEVGGNCAACHAPFWNSGGMAARCMNCHTDIAAQQSDPQSLHNVLLRSKLSGACRTCHPEHRGPDAPLTVLDSARFPHDLLGFPLTGKHASIACSVCHTNNQYHKLPTDCYSCHAKDDTHAGQLGTDCSLCHTPAGWIPSTFNHNLSMFKLEGKHATTPCASCHSNGVFKGTPTDCYSCHAKDDAHAGQFGTDCSLCHSPAAWKPATFDHNLAPFKLDGKHAAVPCASCHINGVFKGTPTDCYSCHAKDDHHGGQFGTACGACHTTSGWLPATFDHNLSTFPLTGAHAGLDCTRCHTNNVFKGTSTLCAACHADPPFHAGMFAGTSCNSCHNTSAWTPASYNGPHPGGCDGNCIGHQGAACRDCHTVNLATATCTKCHANGVPGDGGGGGGGGGD